MPDERCPWCGAERYGGWTWACYTLMSAEESQRSVSCRRSEADQLRARVTRLESALRTIADTNDPGTLPGDMARDALRAEA